MGSGMASTLAAKGFKLRVFDMRAEAVEAMVKKGATAATSVRDCACDVDVLVVAVINDKQVSSVLFDENTGAVTGGFKGACVVCATVPPAFAEEAAAKTAALGAKYVDAPMSGGTAKAAIGQLTFMVSAPESLLQPDSPARIVLDSMGTVYVLGPKPGQGSSMKMVNQLLCGVHIATAAEAMALGSKAGLDTRQVFEIITNAAGNSWMFQNRVSRMIEGDPAVHSAVDIWPKDLGIVLEESKRLGLPCPMAGQAIQQFLAARDLGLGAEDDSFVVKVYEAQGAPKVARPANGEPAAKKSKTA